MSRVAFVTHVGRPAAVAAADELDAGAASRRASRWWPAGDPVDLVIAVGGDGTFLRGAHLAAALDVPVLGREGRPHGVPHPGGAAGRRRRSIRAGPRRRDADRGPPGRGRERSTRTPAFAPQWAMNEIMVEKRARHRLVRLRLEVDGALRDDVLGRRRGRRDPDRLDRLLVLGARPDRVAGRRLPRRHARSRRTWCSTGSFVLSSEQVVTLGWSGTSPGSCRPTGGRPRSAPVGATVTIRASEPPGPVRPAGRRAAVPRPRPGEVRPARRPRRCRRAGVGSPACSTSCTSPVWG